eukprot:1147347-Pelagomonas_calceolata.AAC.4
MAAAPMLMQREPLGPSQPPTSTSGGAPPTQDASVQLWPELHLEVAHPSSHARLVGTHARVSQEQDGNYALNFTQKFRCHFVLVLHLCLCSCKHMFFIHELPNF